MTRTITTAAELDALPVGAGIVDKHGDLGLIDRGVMRGALIVRYAETDVMSVRRAARYLPMAVVHDPSEARPESAHVVPVVSDAAVEASVRVLAPFVFDDRRLPFRTHGESRSTEELREAERAREFAKARAALSAALPFLGAAPSATREIDVERIARDLAKMTALSGADAHLIVQSALTLSGRSATREEGARPLSVDALDALASVVADVETDAWRVTLAFPMRRPATLTSWRTDLLAAITPRTDR